MWLCLKPWLIGCFFASLMLQDLCLGQTQAEPRNGVVPLKQDSGITEEADPSIPLADIVAPATRVSVEAAINKGVEFLLGSQNDDGSWGSPTNTKSLNIYAPVPGAHNAFHAGTTALCIAALCEQEKHRPDLAPAIEDAQDWLMEQLPKLKRANRDAIYNVWGHGYGIQALVRLHRRTQNKDLQGQLGRLIEMQFERLEEYESVDGGWGYYDFEVGARRPTSSSTSFVNATILLAFYEAKELGFEPPQRLTSRAIEATLRQQKSDFSYLYGEYLKNQPMRGINRPGGSLGRSQACNLALRLWGDSKITDQVLEDWLDRMIRRHGWLDIGRKRPIPHEAWMQVAGYFFYYGHYHAALCLEKLPGDKQQRFAPFLAKLIVDRQEKDGSWWDFPLYNYHPPYGTSYALMSLERYREAIPVE
jgi:hypothetical protein